MSQEASTRYLIGVLGGMGPGATIDFMSKIMAATSADVDQEHVPLIVYDVPQIPNRSIAIQTGSDSPFLPMMAGIRMLERSGVDVVAIPCNTAHFWYDRLASSCQVSIIHIADAVATMIQTFQMDVRRVALMATRGTVATGIYRQRLSGVVRELVEPDEPIQQLIDQAVDAVKAGEITRARFCAEQASSRFLEQGADLLLIGCTELPIALAGSEFQPLSIDATEALARACVQASLGVRSLTPVAQLGTRAR
jgi:aspartate racemase